MAQTLNDFITKISNNGIARNNKFEILLPKELDAYQLGYDSTLSDTAELATFYAESVEIPGKVINTIKTRIQGKNIERPYEFLYEGPLSATFLVDTKLQIRKYFEDWMNLVLPNGNDVSFSPNLPKSYKHAMTINIVDNIHSGEIAYSNNRDIKSTPADTEIKETGTYTFYDVYPKYISGINNSQAGRDFHRIKVVFEFDYMVSTYPIGNSDGIITESNSAQEVSYTSSESNQNLSQMLSL